MRKTVGMMLAAGLLVGSLGAPAAAGTKTVKKSYSFGPLAANPVTTDIDPDGCRGETSQEGVHKQTETFTTPRHRKSGTLTFRLGGFQGDWDLYILKGGTEIASSTTDNLSQDYEAVTVGGIKGRTKLSIVACNWSGSPTAEGSLAYKYRG